MPLAFSAKVTPQLLTPTLHGAKEATSSRLIYIFFDVDPNLVLQRYSAGGNQNHSGD